MPRRRLALLGVPAHGTRPPAPSLKRRLVPGPSSEQNHHSSFPWFTCCFCRTPCDCEPCGPSLAALCRISESRSYTCRPAGERGREATCPGVPSGSHTPQTGQDPCPHPGPCPGLQQLGLHRTHSENFLSSWALGNGRI